MRTKGDVNAFAPSRAGREVVRLIRQIQALTVELEAGQREGGSDSELHAKEGSSSCVGGWQPRLAVPRRTT
jgi:hypothetical protein